MVVFMAGFLMETGFLTLRSMKALVTEFLAFESRIADPNFDKPRLLESIVFKANELLSSALFAALEALLLFTFLTRLASPEFFCACTTADYQGCEGKYPKSLRFHTFVLQLTG